MLTETAPYTKLTALFTDIFPENYTARRKSPAKSKTTSAGLQTLHLELLPARERAPEQLRRVPRGARHLDRSEGLERPGAARADDGPAGRRDEPQVQRRAQAVQHLVRTPRAHRLFRRVYVPPPLAGRRFRRRRRPRTTGCRVAVVSRKSIIYL